MKDNWEKLIDADAIKCYIRACKRDGHTLLYGDCAILIYQCMGEWDIEVSHLLTGATGISYADSLERAIVRAIMIAVEKQDRIKTGRGQNWPVPALPQCEGGNHMKIVFEYPNCTIAVYPYRGRWQIELRQPGMDYAMIVDNAPTYGIAENTARRIARTIPARAEGI